MEVMKKLPDKCIDLVLTDPPYGINVGGKSRERVNVGGGKPFGKSGGGKIVSPKSYRGFDDSRIPDKEVFEEMFRISKNQIIFGGNYFVEHLRNSPCWVVWDKDNSGNFADCELAWTSFPTAIRKFKFRWNGMLQEHMGKAKENREHPTQKPVDLMKFCIDTYSEEGQIILDPFLGSGTTAIACINLKRKWIGIEREKEYIKHKN